jgi:NAD+-dependent secondary alcohol dehydrogenase Adh1
VLGHENAGWVHAVGDGVTAAAVGDPVLLYPAWSCGLCVPCRRGQDVFCERHEFTGPTRLEPGTISSQSISTASTRPASRVRGATRRL